MSSNSLKAVLIASLTGFWLWSIAIPVQALPTFARQTGMSCTACHTAYPELTSFGRDFKLEGYVAQNTEQLKDGSDEKGYRLSFSQNPPIAAMMQIADTFIQTPPPGVVANGSDKNGQLEFPSQFSLFYAGALSPKMGAFVQVTYDSASGSFGFDNTDIRIADKYKLGGTDLVAGLTLNNNPTVQDPFNTLPAWGFPYAGGNTAMTPSTGTLVEGLGGGVGGLGVYAFWNHLLYAEFCAYRNAPQGGEATGDPDIQGYAPYWRVALTQDFDEHSIEAGAFGISTNTYPNGDPLTDPAAPLDAISDVGVDAQYQYVGKEHSITLKGSCIWENQNWANAVLAGKTTNAADTFQSLKGDLTYYYEGKIGATVGYFTTTGSNDPLLYAAMSNNIPDSTGWVFELNYLPWDNTKFSLQYTAYSKFDGAADNYDNAGRNASDNNTLMAMAWLMY